MHRIWIAPTCSIFFTALALPAVELAINGNFTNDLTGWQGIGTYSTLQPHSGAGCLQFTDNSSNGAPSQESAALIPFQHGQRYRLSLWARGERANQTVEVTLLLYRADGTWISGKNQNLQERIGTTWTQLSMDLVTLPPATASMRVSMRPVPWTDSGSNQGTAWFDDVSLQTIDDPVTAGHALAVDLAGGPGLWVAPGEQKVTPGMRLPSNRSTVAAIEFAAARREYDVRQLVLLPTAADSLVSMVASEGVNANGDILPASAWQVREVAYVTITTASDRLGVLGEQPDPLPELSLPLALSANRNQPLWMTLLVPAATKAGTYAGTLTVRYGSGAVQQVPWRAQVRGFTLPSAQSLRGSYGIWTNMFDTFHHLGGDPDLTRQVFRHYLRDCVAHRLGPANVLGNDNFWITFPHGDDRPVLDFSAFDSAVSFAVDELGISDFHVVLPSFAGGALSQHTEPTLRGHAWGSPGYEAIYLQVLEQLQTHLESRGWLEKAYVYWYDEPGPADIPFVKQGMDLIKRGAPGLRRLLTYHYDPDLAGAVDIWAPLLDRYERADAPARQALGEKFWWYVCNIPLAPYPTNFIDHPGTEHRIRPWMAWQAQVDGELYWTINYTFVPTTAFPTQQDPWVDPMSYSSYDHSHWDNGEGLLVYPPRAWRDGLQRVQGPVPSIRWELLREGAEDHAALTYLDSLCDQLAARGNHATLLTQARALLTVPDALTASPAHFTVDPTALTARRAAVDVQIETIITALGSVATVKSQFGRSGNAITVSGADLDGNGHVDAKDLHIATQAQAP